MKKLTTWLLFFSIILSILAFSLFEVHSQSASFSTPPNLHSLVEFEESILNGMEYQQLPLHDCIFYVAYAPLYSSIYLYILERQADGYYTIVIEEGGIGFTIDRGQPIASEFMFTPLQMNIIFSPTSITPHEGYREIVFSNAYLYTSEDYIKIYPFCSSK